MAAQIIPFPRPVHQAPHDAEAWKSKPPEFWTLADSVEEARFRCSELKAAIADMDETNPRTRPSWAGKMAALHWWSGELIQREASASGTLLQHNGFVFTETVGRA